MTAFNIRVEPIDIFGKPVRTATVTFHRHGRDVESLRGDSTGQEIEIEAGEQVTVRVSERRAWPVEQALRATTDRVEIVPPHDAFAWFHMTGTPQQRRYTVRTKLTLFRDADPDCKSAGWNPVPNNQHHLFVFSNQTGVLSTTSPGWKRLRGSLKPNQPSIAAGQLWFLKAPASAGVPQIAAVFAPNTFNQNRPAHIHTFHCPKTKPDPNRPKAYTDYPFGHYFKEVFDNYLVNGGKRILNQHVASKKNALLVFPMPPPGAYYKGIDTGKGLKRYLHEVVAFLPKRLLVPELEYCVVSGFSAAGAPLLRLMRTSLTTGFTELKELYSLDCIINAVTQLGVHSRKWLKQGDRRLRFYIARKEFLAVAIPPDFVSASRPTKNLSAEDWSTSRTTWFRGPLAFWETVAAEQQSQTPNPKYFPNPLNNDRLHQLMPLVMLTHSLANSGLA